MAGLAQNIPSWLQSFAAIVALGISVLALRQTNAVERRRDKLRARGIVAAIYPELMGLGSTIAATREGLVQLKRRSRTLVGQAIAATVQTGIIYVPPMLERNVDNFYLLGEPAGPACLQLVTVLLQYNSMVGDAAASMMTMNAQEWPTSVEHLERQLSEVGSLTSKCLANVQPLYKEVKGLSAK